MVELLDILRFMPLVSAGAWLILAILQVGRDRWHTWTEMFFLATCFSAGLYAVSDWMLFNADRLFPEDPGAAAIRAALLSNTTLVLAALFFLLFTSVYVGRMRRSYWLFPTVSVIVLAVVWSPSPSNQSPGAWMLERVIAPTSPGALYLPVFSPVPFGIFLAYILALSLAGLVNLYRLYRIVREQSPALARRAGGLFITFSFVLVVGLMTNGILGITHNDRIPPPYSTLIIFLAAGTYVTLYPGGRQRISEAIRRFQAQRYSIKAVFLAYDDGTLIGSKARPGETLVDQDLFGATLDVIQNFMRTSFPMLRGKWLSAISQGPYILVMERGRHTYLTVVLEGQESDQLRRQMRDLILAFEDRNREVLRAWQGVPSQAQGTEEMLSRFFAEEPPPEIDLDQSAPRAQHDP